MQQNVIFKNFFIFFSLVYQDFRQENLIETNFSNKKQTMKPLLKGPKNNRGKK